jgi:two-component system, NtrC family, sensor kinase
MSNSFRVRQLVTAKRRVLIVDDNHAIHDDFRKILAPVSERGELDELHAQMFGGVDRPPTETFEVESVFQGEEAIVAVRTAGRMGAPYALAFVDVRMPPGIDGLQTTTRLLDEDPDLCIVVCSAYSDHSWEEMTETFGDTDRVLLLRKPFDTMH